MKIVIYQFVLFIAVFTSLSSISARSLPSYGEPRDHIKFMLGGDNLGSNGILSLNALAPGPANNAPTSTLVLAAKRTKRPDILRGFKRYRNGWDITNKHYWASVGFTGAPGFILAVLWFVSFGSALLVHYCCGWRISSKGSQHSQTICLIMLIVFTCAAVVGCILLSVGQDKFHGEALDTLNYVVNQSDYTAQTLRNVTEYLSIAKTIHVAQIFLPSDVTDEIDKVISDLKNAADMLTEKTNENSGKIKKVFNAVKSSLITVAAAMLLLSLLGLLLSVLGKQHAVLIFIFSGWLLVAITFILCGAFVILNNAISDTCMAMGEWVDNSHAETALSNILPCVDQRTTNRTLIQSKQVITDIVNIVDQFIDGVANSKPSPQAQDNPSNYNQSGPLMPRLCQPYDNKLQDIPCPSQELSIENASLVWHDYICRESASPGKCSSAGRVTQDMYAQLVAAVNISYALEHYTPPLLSFQNCNFVRDTFRYITSAYCRPLRRHLQMVNAGLGLISVGVMLCLALWLLYANRPQKGGSVCEDGFTNKKNLQLSEQ